MHKNTNSLNNISAELVASVLARFPVAFSFEGWTVCSNSHSPLTKLTAIYGKIY